MVKTSFRPTGWNPDMMKELIKLSLQIMNRFQSKQQSWDRDSKMTKRLFMNDVTQVGGEGMWFCDIEYEDASKTLILAWQRGKGGRFWVQIVWRHLWLTPKKLFSHTWIWNSPLQPKASVLPMSYAAHGKISRDAHNRKMSAHDSMIAMIAACHSRPAVYSQKNLDLKG